MARFDPKILTTQLPGVFQESDKVPRLFQLMRWPIRIRCPHCRSSRITRFGGAWKKPEGRYVYLCYGCRRQFTVTTGTALHRTHVPLAKWLEAIALMKGKSRKVTAAQLVRALGVTHKTAQKMCARLRQGMKGHLLRNLALAIRLQKSWERIYRNIFPDLYEDGGTPPTSKMGTGWWDPPEDSGPLDDDE